MSDFESLGIDAKILNVIKKLGYKEPTPIQQLAIPVINEGTDVVASAQTGTGKTAAFLIPILQRLANNPRQRSSKPRALILVPTRELAEQVAKEASIYSKAHPNVKTAVVFGGVSYMIQRKQLERGCDILVATPGRLIDLLDRKRVNLSEVEFFVLDEADRMLDMGFIAPVERIASEIKETKQTLLFSATIDKKIVTLSKKLQNNPRELRVTFSETTASSIEQKLFYVDNIGHKKRLLEHLLEAEEIGQGIIFTSTKRQAGELADHLRDLGYRSGSLHGDMNQSQRTRTLGKVRKGIIKILVATDVAARGIDVASLTHVFNFDLPGRAEDFVHRIGRTGRAGACGIAISFAKYEEEPVLRDIGKFTGIQLNICTIEGMEPRPKSKSTARPGAFKGGPRGRKPGGGGSNFNRRSKPFEKSPKFGSNRKPQKAGARRRPSSTRAGV